MPFLCVGLSRSKELQIGGLMIDKAGSKWEDLRREICESLNSKKSELVKDILRNYKESVWNAFGRWKDADVLFLQEAERNCT